MKRKITYPLMFLLVLFIALALVSCAGAFGNDDGGAPSGGVVDNDKGKYNQIVIYDSEMDILDIRYKIFGLKGVMPVSTPDSEVMEREIVFGDTSRQITALAKSELAKLKSGKNDSDFGYIIYSDGKSVAIYWEHENLMALALNKFTSVCIDEKALMLDSGVVLSALYSKKDTEQEAVWLAIENTVSTELYRSLRAFAGEINGAVLCEWLANLYDSEQGGFYYSASARDYEGFLPDMESTAQALSYLASSKAVTDINKDFPNDLKIKIVDFFISRQSESDGYFYHPQWPIGTDKLQSDRYGRDLGSATTWIARLTVDRDGDGVEEKQYPKVCTPNGYKCREHDLNGGVCASVIATAFDASLRSSVSSAVSQVLDTTVRTTSSASSKPDFTSAQSFLAWLESANADIKTDPDTASHYINAWSSEIIARGYADVLLDYLDRIQQEVYEEQTERGDKPSGLWSYDATSSLGMAIHKYMSAYYNSSVCGRELKYYKEAISTCIDIMLIDISDSALNILMNNYIGVTHILTNVRKYNPDDLPELCEMIRARGVEIINIARANLETHALENGTFAYDNGRSLVNLYGVTVSRGEIEADVNGLQMIVNFYNSIFNLFNLPSVSLCSTDDGDSFVETIYSLEPIDKKPLPNSTIDFEDKTLMQIPEVKIVKNTSDGAISIIEDPLGENGNILSFYSGIGTPSGDFLNVLATDNGGNCNIAEFDFLIAERSVNSELYQVFIDNGFMLTISTDGSYLRIDVISDGVANPNRTVIINYSDRVRVDEWHRIRFEAYDPINGGELPVIKVFVDDELRGESSIYYRSDSGANYASNFAWFKIYSKAGVITDTYVDNIYCSRESKEYIEGDDDISDLRS